MKTMRNRVITLYIPFLLGCVFIIGSLQCAMLHLEKIIPSFSPLLFPTLTIFLLVFHLFMSCFMIMKYWCDRTRLYLVPIAFAFVGSAIMMVGTLASFPGWLDLYHFASVNYNDAMIFFLFRHLMMATLFLLSAFLFRLRRETVRPHFQQLVIFFIFLFTVGMLISAWLYSSHSPFLSMDLVDNENKQFMILWQKTYNMVLIALWCVTLAVLMSITRLRNLFWMSGNFLCISYIAALVILLFAGHTEGYTWYTSRLFETLATLMMIFVLLCDVFRLYRLSNARYQQSYQNSIRDALTRLYNRSYFYDTLTHSLKSASENKPVSVIVSDLDRFKRINDTYGHLQGDNVLQFVAQLLMDSVRPEDIAARIGGEEFVLLLQNTGSADAQQVAERIRLSLSAYDTESSHGQLPESITISMGVYTATTSDVSAEACVGWADQAMYQAKESGRNRVVVWQ